MNTSRHISAIFSLHLVFLLSISSIIPSYAIGTDLKTTIEASVSTAVDTYTDLSESHVNADAVGYLSAEGAIQGYADGTFKPDQAVNRAEALKIILLGAKMEVSEKLSTSAFFDVPSSAWYVRFVAKAKAMGIVKGNPDGSFKPATTLNLAEALKIVLLTKQIDVIQIRATGSVYNDVSASAWYAPYVLYAKNKNLIEADSQNRVYPAQPMTRGKLVELMYRLSIVLENQLESFPTESEIQSAQGSSSDTGTSGTGTVSSSGSTDGSTGTTTGSGSTSTTGGVGTTGGAGTTSGTSNGGSTGVELEAKIEISVSAGNYFFSPNEIRIQAGQDTEIQFSEVSGFHDFVIDELGISQSLSASGTTTVNLNVATPGTYIFYCSVGNHRAQGMEGTLIVE